MTYQILITFDTDTANNFDTNSDPANTNVHMILYTGSLRGLNCWSTTRCTNMYTYDTNTCETDTMNL